LEPCEEKRNKRIDDPAQLSLGAFGTCKKVSTSKAIIHSFSPVLTSPNGRFYSVHPIITNLFIMPMDVPNTPRNPTWKKTITIITSIM